MGSCQHGSRRAIAGCLAALGLAVVGVVGAGGSASAPDRSDVAGGPDRTVRSEAAAPRTPVRRAGSFSGSGRDDGRLRTVRKARGALRPSPVPGYTGRGQGRPADPLGLPDSPFAPTVPPTAEAPAPAGASERATGDFTVFRNTITGTSTGTSGSADALEPTAANDRNGIIATANFYAAVSSDNGMTFSSLDPTLAQLYGGFCCDQVAYAVDRGAYSLVFWLMQDWPSTSADQNALRLWMFRGRTELLAPQDESEVCDWAFEPQPDFDLPRNRWFDFNQISHTEGYLYITTNVRDSSGNSPSNDWSDGPKVGGMIFRIALDDLDDGNCSITRRYWYRDGDPYISPVQSAGSTMYLATHRTEVTGQSVGGIQRLSDQLRIFSVADSSDSLVTTNKEIEDFDDGVGNCPLPGGLDPCKDQHSGRMSGFRSGSTVGWMWMANQDENFPFPHVRVAAFSTPSLTTVVEHQIWSAALAWQLPSVGVNEEGDLGVILYAMGGGKFPRAQGFIRTDPRVWSGIQMTAIADSDSAPPDNDGDGSVSFGHYGSVRPYGNCPETFLGSAYTVEGDQGKGRFVWFGKEGDGCVDLTTTRVSKTGAGPFGTGETMTVTTTVQNQGAIRAAPSSVGYYLSSDRAKSDDDISFDTERLTEPLDPRESQELEATVRVPIIGLLPREFFLIACADNPGRVTEVSDTNNCAASTNAFTVEPTLTNTPMRDLSLSNVATAGAGTGTGAPALKPAGTFTVTDTVRTLAGAAGAAPSVSYALSSTRVPDDDLIPLAGRVVGAPGPSGATRVTTRRLTLPRRVPPGQWYLTGCIRHPRGQADTRARNDCLTATRTLTVTGDPQTPGPARPRDGPQ